MTEIKRKRRKLPSLYYTLFSNSPFLLYFSLLLFHLFSSSFFFLPAERTFQGHCFPLASSQLQSQPPFPHLTYCLSCLLLLLLWRQGQQVPKKTLLSTNYLQSHPRGHILNTHKSSKSCKCIKLS